MAVDLSILSFLMPLFGFVFVFLVLYAILRKTKLLGEEEAINVIVSLIVAIVFVSISSIRSYLEVVTPWFAVLFVIMLFVVLLVSMSQKDVKDFLKPWFVWVFIIIFVVILLIAAINVFTPNFESLLPGGSEAQNSSLLKFFYSSQVSGAILLIIVAIIVVAVVTRKVKK